eukprot:5790862-Amphidinium_carterae.1
MRRRSGNLNLEHIVLHCPHWNKERLEACLPAHTAVAPACVRLHGLLPAPGPGLLPAHEPALLPKAGVTTVWTDGSGKHSSNPHFRRCGVGYDVTSPTRENDAGWPFQAYDNLFFELNS